MPRDDIYLISGLQERTAPPGAALISDQCARPAADLVDNSRVAPPMRVNWRLVAPLVVLLIASIVTVRIVHGRQFAQMIDTVRARAAQAEAAGDYESAARHFQTYLGLVPNDAATRADLGFLLLEEPDSSEDYLQAYFHLDRALQLDPKRNDVRRKLAELAMAFTRYREAAGYLKPLVESSPDDELLRVQLAECYRRIADYPAARAVLEDLITQEPEDVSHYELLATLLSEKFADQQAADELMDRLVTANPQSAEARCARAEYMLRQGRVHHALLDAQRALALDRGHLRTLTLVAELVASRGTDVWGRNLDLPAIRRGLEAGLEASPRDPAILCALAGLDLSEGNAELAVERLEPLFDQDSPSDGAALHDGVRHLYGEALVNAQRYDEVRRLIARLRREQTDETTVALLTARLSVAEENWLDALRVLEALRLPESAGWEPRLHASLLLGRCYEALSHPDRQRQAYAAAVEIDPTHAGARYGLADALARLGRLEEAIGEYRLLADRAEARLALIRLLIAVNRNRAPEDRNWAEIESLLESKGGPVLDAGDVVLVRADLAVARDEPQEAAEMLAAAVEDRPTDTELWLALAEVRRRLDGAEAALHALHQAQEHVDRNGAVLAAEVRCLADVPEAAAKIEAIEAEAAALAPDEQEPVWAALGLAWEQLGEFDRAQEAWRRLCKLRPLDLVLRLELVERAIARGAGEEVQRLLDELRTLEGERGCYWRLGVALQCLARAEQGDLAELEQARRLLDEAAPDLSQSARASLALARIEALEGDAAALAVQYEEALSRGAADPRIIERLVRLYHEREQFAKASTVLRKYGARYDGLLTGQFGRLAVEVALGSREFDRAVLLARDLSEAEGASADAAWLADVLIRSGRPTEAEAVLRTALGRDESSAENWFAWVSFLASQGRGDAVQEAIDEARAAVAEPELAFLLARCFDAAGEPVKADEQYQLVLAQRPEVPEASEAAAGFYLKYARFADAEPILRRLLAAADSPAATARLRRSLAAAVAPRGVPGLREALILIESNLIEFGETAADLRARAGLLALWPSARTRDTAIAGLNRLAERYALSDSDLYLLAQLHTAAGRWRAEARTRMDALVARHPERTDYLAFAARGYLADGQAGANVGDLVQRLEQLEPEAFRSRELRVRLLIAQDRIDQALTMLLSEPPAGSQAATDPAQGTAWRRASATLLADVAAEFERRGKSVEAERFARIAERLYRELAEVEPSDTLRLARFLGQRWRLREALEVCESAWATLPPEEVAATMVDLLRSGRPAAGDIDRVASAIREAVERAEAPPAALIAQLAHVTSLTGDFDAAQALYEQVLESEPNSVVACNELALLMTLRGGDLEEALRLIERALQVAGPLPHLLDTRATVYLALDRPEPAIDDLTNALADAPSPVKQFHLAQALMAQQDTDAARTALQTAMGMGLASEMVHPLERPQLEQLRAALQ